MAELLVKWPKVVSYEPIIKWIDLCNGTMFRIISFLSKSPRRGLFVGIERLGCFLFSIDNYKSGDYVSQKLNLNPLDAKTIADWINAQLEIKEGRQQGHYYLNYLDKVEAYYLLDEEPEMPLIPEIISE